MKMSHFGKFSFLLIFFLALPEFLPRNTHSLLCPIAAWGSGVRNFGRDGRDGRTGRNGNPGRNGPNQTLFLDGSPVNIDLSGGQGESGREGSEGEHADCGRQPRDVKYDVQGPDGGDGGNGGRGGNGGNGGTLTLYYTDPAHLRNVFLDAAGGEGGESGRGGQGGEGCRCRRPSWEMTTCTGTPNTPDYKCETQRYYCDDGQEGRRGRSGQNGNSGQIGRLVLIRRSETLPPGKASTTVTLLEAQDNPPILYLNLWRSRRGSTALLAPGSVVADEYREFVERIQGTFQLVWNAPQSINDFAEETARLDIDKNKQVNVRFSENAWLEGTLSQQPGQTQFVVSDAMLKSEALRLLRTGFVGSGSDLTVEILDVAAVSDKVSSQFVLKYRAKGEMRFEGAIPPELVSRDKNIFKLNIGKLPIAPEFLELGTRVEVEVTAIRSFGSHSAQQILSWRGTVRE